MRFKVGDKVKEIHPPYQEGTVAIADNETQTSTGEWYLVEFPDGGNEWTNGAEFVVIETDFA